MGRLTVGFLLLFACLPAAYPPAPAAELKQKSFETFDRYVRLTEARIGQEVQQRDRFLWVDTLPDARREEAYARLREGQVVVERLRTLDAGQSIHDDDSIIHHWVGVVLIPGATLEQTVSMLQQYDHHAEIFKPDVQRCRILERHGNDFKVFFRFYKKKAMVTTVYNSDHDIRYFPVDATHEYSRAYTTRIQQVENAGKPDERERPVGRDDGYMWRLYTYWRFQEKDGGTYVQCESVTLTRDIPALLRWIIAPFVESVPRESLVFTLGTTRNYLLRQQAVHNAQE